MKRIILAITILGLLTGCRYQDFDYGSPVIVRPEDYDSLLDMIIDQGNYSADVKGPYSRFHLYISYISGTESIEGLNVSKYRDYNGTETTYDTTDCFSVDTNLKCREYESSFDGERILPEIEFTYAFAQIANIDIPSMVHEIKTHYGIGCTKEILVYYSFVLPDEINSERESVEDVIIYYDEQYLYDTDYVGSDLMLEIKVIFFYEEDGVAYTVFRELVE